MASKMSLLKIITREVKYRLEEESVPRIKKCFDHLSEEEIWRSPNENLTSVGNLILHLCGNVRQYILFGLGNAPDNRKRQEEFDHQDIISKDILLSKLDELMLEVDHILDELPAESMTRKYNVQGMEITGFGILMHVVEHFSYHVGQITWYTKLVKDIDMKYYGDRDLNKTGN